MGGKYQPEFYTSLLLSGRSSPLALHFRGLRRRPSTTRRGNLLRRPLRHHGANCMGERADFISASHLGPSPALARWAAAPRGASRLCIFPDGPRR